MQCWRLLDSKVKPIVNKEKTEAEAEAEAADWLVELKWGVNFDEQQARCLQLSRPKGEEGACTWASVGATTWQACHADSCSVTSTVVTWTSF